MPSIIIETDDDCELVTIEQVTELVDIQEITFLDDGSTITDILESINQTCVLDVLQVTDIVDSCVQGPKGAKGDSATGQFNITVPAGSTLVIDNLSVATNPSAKWFLTALDTVNVLRKSSEVAAIHNGTTACHVHYGKIGDIVPYGVNVVVNGLFFQLELINYHTEDLDLKILRMSTVL